MSNQQNSEFCGLIIIMQQPMLIDKNKDNEPNSTGELKLSNRIHNRIQLPVAEY